MRGCVWGDRRPQPTPARRVREIEVEIRPPRLPAVLKPAVEVAASQGQDSVRSPRGPEHPGLFETDANYGFASGLDHTRADREVLAAKPG